MRYQTQHLPVLPDVKKSQCFVTSTGQILDYSPVSIVHNGIDTLKLLYSGNLSSSALFIESRLDNIGNSTIELFGTQWVLGRLSKVSGFKYFLNNQELGVIILLVSAYTKADHDGLYPTGLHMKMEFSPHYLMANDVDTVQTFADSIASHFLLEFSYSGVSCHLACDVQGWSIPSDFNQRFVTRSRPNQERVGIESLDILSTAVIYGARQSLLYGSANNVQFAIYDKTLEAVSHRKLQFWESVWLKKNNEQSESVYQIGQSVKRFEVRFHHSVIKQLTLKESLVDGQLTFSPVLCYRDLVQYLPSIWQYALLRLFRLQYNTATIDPMWTILLDPNKVVWIGKIAPLKRVYQKISEGTERNVSLVLGNMLTLFARAKYSVERCFKYIRSSGLWDSIFMYYFKRLFPDLYNDLKVRRLSTGIGSLNGFFAKVSQEHPNLYTTVVDYIRRVISQGLTKRVLAGITI